MGSLDASPAEPTTNPALGAAAVLTRRYRIGLTIVASLVVLNALLVQPRLIQGHVSRLLIVGWLLTGLVLLVLVGIGHFILRPASDLVDRQYRAMAEARDRLAARELEHARELDQAHRDLAAEIQHRGEIEERQRQLVERFSHVARTTTIAEMASGLAHELTQPLGALANYAEGCLVEMEAPAPALGAIKTTLTKILATTHRASAIVKRIHRFVTRKGPRTERLEPQHLVSEVSDFVADLARRREVELRIEVASNLPSVLCDPVQIQQVLVNLVRNAFDAMTATQAAKPVVVIAVRPDASGALEFAVTDNGEGIPNERLPHLFDAYFSTRDEGMGLGLAISRTIVEAHHGRIEARSSLGDGSTFRFILPAADDS